VPAGCEWSRPPLACARQRRSVEGKLSIHDILEDLDHRAEHDFTDSDGRFDRADLLGRMRSWPIPSVEVIQMADHGGYFSFGKGEAPKDSPWG
jgi:hypothetical protein